MSALASLVRRAKAYGGAFIPSAADPSTLSGAVQIYAKTVSGTVQFFAMNGAGTVYQLTPTQPGPYNVTGVQTSAYNAVIWDFVLCDPSGGGFTVTLPTAVGVNGKSIRVKNKTSSVNTITLATTSSQTIDGSSNLPIIERGFALLEFVSDNSNWWVA